MSQPAHLAAHCGPEDHCITCAAEGVVMRVAGIEDGEGLARCVRDDGAPAEGAVDRGEPVEAGDLILVHAGVALARLEEPA